MKQLSSFLFGIVVGGAAALLYAPDKGRKVRKRLKKEGEAILKDLEVQADKGIVKLNELKEKGNEKLADLKNSTGEFVENAAKKVNSSMN